ncbi:HAMP domain-containing sensor histidine kinase [Thauera linaloolentis]|uniref:histidine kinase n=1 Tax=Thauera linaloolentis (strain DSM 12138 / JCM 21573 / CCUG 41526 / CIP 105981 / IAM 15112 / NBRC 102519 / 47Lol) TaxID=1123367 RepID=N6YY02_THAL4|nr:ATP-binding protein [Thauera linaloolentis]ENO84809.1 sensor histidine kinase [Thauera linaloolentis 47Lol = DSM 12138]MCM8566694.1 ATP-binding protein [Thauera linaloolentis]
MRPGNARNGGMGRLFWKFFFFFWLAQLVTSLGVGVTIWLLRPDSVASTPAFPHPPPGMFAPGPPAGREHQPPFPASAPQPDRARPPPWMPPLMPLMAGSVVSLLFAALLAWYFARPIRKLRGAFEAVAAGRLDTRIGDSLAGRDDELARLGQDFDRMAERLQDLLDGRQRLLHDVSHELRSPLARLQAAADLARQRPERGESFIERVERETVRMDRLVGELLTLARLDAGMAESVAEEVDLAELIARIAEDAELEGRVRGCAIGAEVDEDLHVAGHPELLHRMLENVVRNAVRHSPEHGYVHIGAHADPGRGAAVVDIADTGPGVPEEDLESIFQPFRRGEGAAAGGYGLGLAIARRVAEAHGGGVSAANRPGGGLRVSISLPLAARSTTPSGEGGG